MILFNLCIITVFGLYIIHNVVATVAPDYIKNHLGSKTPYRFKCNKNEAKISFPGCKDKKMWMIIRHGTRMPSKEDIEGMHTTLKNLTFQILLGHKTGKGKLRKNQLAEIKNWSCDLDHKHEKDLVAEGKDEMVHLAKRMKKRFPNILNHKYSKQHYMIRFTPTERAQESARHFTIGLFDKNKANNVIMLKSSKADEVLRFYKYCDKWLIEVKRNDRTYEEQRVMKNSSLMADTLQSISERLALNETISVDTAILIYKTCAYEVAWTKNYLSPWCFAFDVNTIKVLEYYYDVRHYWLDGYGDELNSRSACSSVKNMFDLLTSKKELSPNATLLFAHSGTVLKVLAHLGLYKPKTPLRGDAIPNNNVWRMSEIDCFGSNLAFVLFECETGEHLLTLHQERIIKLPMCDSELCPLERLVASFRDTIHNCDHSSICNFRDRNEL